MGKPDGKGGGQPAADSRFAAMHSDPRFQRFPKQKNKVVVDKRFAGMFEDPDFQNRSAVDKRGRKIEARRRNEDLRRYYRLKDEDEWRQEGGAEEVEEGDDKEEGQQQQQKEAEEKKEKKKPAGKDKGDVGPRRVADQGAAAAQRKALAGKGKGKEPADGMSGAAQEAEEGQAASEARRKGAKRQRAAAAAAPAPAAAAATRTGAVLPKDKGQRGGAGRPAVGGRATGEGRKGPADERDSSSEGSEGEEDVEEEEDIVEGFSGSGDEEELDALQRGEGSDAGDEDEEGEDEDDDEAEDDEEAARARERWARARGMLGSESSDEGGEEGEYDSADEPLTDEEYESDEPLDTAEWGAGSHALNPEEPIPEQEETRRLALVDLDWDHVRAVDVLVALRSFLPRGAAIERVTVYPSDYGLQRMAEEAAVGPRLILKPTQRSAAEGEKGGSAAAGAAAAAAGADQGKPAGKKPRGGAAANGADDDAEAEVDKRRLAAYEKSRLRYYYAIVECDCVATALHLYNECDGMEFERSACKFDLRFVPDNQSFKGRQVRDCATEVPPDYQPPAYFNISLQHTDPKLSWDAEDPERKRKLQGRRLKTDEELLEADFAAYLGSDDDEDEAEEEEEEQDAQQPAAAGAGAAAAADPKQDKSGAVGTKKSTQGRGGKEDAEALRRRYRALLLGDAAVGEDAGGAAAAKTKGRVGGKSWLGSEDGEEADDAAEAEAQRDRERRRGGGEPSTSGRGSGGAAGGGRKGGDVDMVVTFHSGLEGLGERLKKKKEEERARAGETVWEAYLRKKREKRAQRKALGRLRNLSDSEDSDDYISDGEDDRRAKGKAKGRDAAAAATAGKGKGAAAEATGRKGKRGGGDDEDDLYGDVPSDDPFFQHDDGADPFADPFFKEGGDGGAAGPGAGPGSGGDATAKDGKKAKKGRKDKTADGKGAGVNAEKADLELLLMDDAALRDAARGVKTRVLPAGHDDADGAGGKRKLTKKEKREMKKEAKRRARVGSDEEDAAGGGQDDAGPGFNVNLDDPRFADMFRSAEFALDPTDPRFKKMEAREKVLTEVKKRRSQPPTTHQDPEDRKQQRQQNGGATANGGAHEAQEQQRAGAGGGTDLRIMVAKLKRKAEAQHEKERAQALGKGTKKTRL